MASEITEEAEEPPLIISTEAQKDKIRRIIEYQKSLYASSSSSSSAAASYSSFSSSRRSNSLLDLMKDGNTSLRRLFDMEHTSLATHFKDYSGSPFIKPILLWGSDTDDGIYEDPWSFIIPQGDAKIMSSRTEGQIGSAPEGSFVDEESVYQNRKLRIKNRKLSRKKSFRRLPRFSIRRWGGFRLRFRLKRLKILLCGRKF